MMGESETEKFIDERKERLFAFLKSKPSLITYVLLAFVIFLALWIRTINVDGLVDVSTSSPTLGPDLDPFLFLRWSEYIVEHGKLFSIDNMRYVPLGFDTTGEYL